jgi:putative ABC transport system permease protein
MFGRRRRSGDDFAREVEAHLDLETDRLIGEGMDPAAARLAARRSFGTPLATRERFHEAGRWLWADQLWQDVRHGARSLTKYPVSGAVAVVSLAAGIGATTASLTIRDVVFHKPPALYRAPAELSVVHIASRDRPIRGVGHTIPPPLYDAWRLGAVGGTVAAAAPEEVREVRVNDRRQSVRIRRVSPNFFATLGVNPLMGRTFPDNVHGRGARPAVLSYRVWKYLLEGRDDVVGTQIWIGADSFTIVGVMPERFWFSVMDSPIWMPLSGDAAATDLRLQVVVRRDSSVAPRQLADRLQPALTEYSSHLPADERPVSLKLSPMEGTPIADNVAIAFPYLLGGAVLLTLLIACANVAILVIAQWTAREHEIAIRASLGAGRGRIVRALVVESVLLAVAGGLLGICATIALQGIMLRNAGPNLVFFDLTIEPRIFVQAVIITLLTGIAAGIGPALLETRRLQGNPMRTIARPDRVRQRWRHALVLAEIAVTVALLVVAGGMLDTYRRNYAIDVGYQTRPLVLLRVESGKGVQTNRVVEVLKRIPGVAAASPSTSIPFLASGSLQRFSAQPGALEVRAEQASISPDFFGTLDVPVRKGRGFTVQDAPQTRAAIVNESLAARLFAGLDPVGRQLWMGQTSYDVVGVVADYKNTSMQNHDWDPKVFVPLPADQTDKKSVAFLVRASADAVAVERAIRREIPNAAAGHAIAQLVTLDQVIDVAGQEILVGTAPLAPLIATGMFLTAAGIYGVLAFSIARRSRELAVRIAIGATRRNIVELVASHSLRLVVIGALCGVGATFALSRVVRAFDTQDSFLDPSWVSFVVPVGIILAVGLLATWVPSRRATRIDPSILLRAQ